MAEINYGSGMLSSKDLSSIDFEKNAQQYPFSALAQFQLLYHFKNQNDPRFDRQIKRTAIQFTNPLWMRFQLAQAIHHSKTEQIVVSSDISSAIIEDEPEEMIVDSPEIIQPIEKVENSEPEITHVENTPETFEPHPVDEAPIAPIENLEVVEEKTPESDVNETPAYEAGNDEMIGELELEPLSMRDYFASQGITIPAELLENDQLGRQMKSFTAWLKEMKRLHGNKLPEQNPIVEKMIQQSAEKSNSQQEILTETMAEIFLKQGRPDKALQLYQKLSLMNPAKSTYFAAKIDSLKNN